MANQNTQTQDPNDLISQLAAWAANGGGNSAQGSMATNSDGSTAPVMSPAIASNAATGVSGGSTNNGGYVGSNNTPNNVGGMAVSSQGNNVDIGQLLQGLINNLNTPNQSKSSQGGVPVGPYQKGVNKTLQAAGEQHSAQALQAGMNPNDIANHSVMGGGQQQPQVQVPTGQPQQPQAQQQPLSMQDQINQLNQQAALNIAKRNVQASQPQNFMQRFSQNFTKMTGGVTQADQLVNMGTIQKLAAAEPIQPKDVADLNAKSYAAAMDAAHNGVTAEASKLAGLEDLYGKEQPNRSPIDAMLGRESKNQTLIRQNIEKSAENITNHLSNLRTLVANRPTFSAQGVDKQAQNISKMIEGGVYKDGSGNTAKYVGGKFVPVSGGK